MLSRYQSPQRLGYFFTDHIINTVIYGIIIFKKRQTITARDLLVFRLDFFSVDDNILFQRLDVMRGTAAGNKSVLLF